MSETSTREELQALAALVFIDAHGNAHMTGDQWRRLHEIARGGVEDSARLRTLQQNYDVTNERYEFWMEFVRDLSQAIHWPGDAQMRDAIPFIADCVNRVWPPCACGDLCIPDEMHRCRKEPRVTASPTLGDLRANDSTETK